MGLCCLLAFDLAECRKFDHFAIILLLFCFLSCLIYRITELALLLEGIIFTVIGVFNDILLLNLSC